MNDIPHFLYDKDLIFHYTKVNTTVYKILKDNKLKLSPRQKSNDPIEKNIPSFFVEWFNSKYIPKNTHYYDYFKNKFIKKCKNFKLLCFCTNGSKIIRKKKGTSFFNYEYFGFLKPRMWDQYGDHYNGVCLVFSKKKIKQYSGYQLKKIQYCSYNILKENQITVNNNECEEIGQKEYEKFFFRKYEYIYFQKHIDYKHENELRLYTESDTCPLFDFKDSLRAIIINSNLKYKSKNEYLEIQNYTKQNNIDLVEIIWKVDGILFNLDNVFNDKMI